MSYSKIDLYTVGKYGIHEHARFDRTIKFLDNRVFGRTLDIGKTNEFSKWLEKYYSIAIDNTDGDLNYPGWLPRREKGIYDTIFMFEVIEHLLNPLTFLNELSKLCNNETRVFITYPAGTWIAWCMKMHFHEIKRDIFQVLLEHSPFVEVRYENVFLWKDWRYWLFRVRPFLRYVVFGLRYQFYEIKIK